MPISRKALCIAYALIALAALVGTWSHNLAYLERGFASFGLDTLANPASRSITVDLFFLSIAVIAWMVLEARRLGMRLVWLYVVFGLLVAISVTVPIFLINRERALAAREPSASAGTLSAADIAALAAVSVAVIAYTVLSLTYTAS